jgi:hypothetical protein
VQSPWRQWQSSLVTVRCQPAGDSWRPASNFTKKHDSDLEDFLVKDLTDDWMNQVTVNDYTGCNAGVKSIFIPRCGKEGQKQERRGLKPTANTTLLGVNRETDPGPTPVLTMNRLER